MRLLTICAAVFGLLLFLAADSQAAKCKAGKCSVEAKAVDTTNSFVTKGLSTPYGKKKGIPSTVAAVTTTTVKEKHRGRFHVRLPKLFKKGKCGC